MTTAPCLGNLVRALFLKRPPSRKLLPSWSLPAVLEALSKPPFEPLAEATLRNLTIKTVFLVAIASGQRRSALHALSTAPGHVRWERTGVRLIPSPSYIAKNQTASSAPVEVLSNLSRPTPPLRRTKCGVQYELSSITGTALRRSARVTSSLLSLKSLSPRLRVTPFPNGLSQLSRRPVLRPSRPELHPALTTPEVLVRRGRSSVVFQWKKYTKRLTGVRPIRLLPSIYGTFLPRLSPISTLSFRMCFSHASPTSLCWSSIL